MTSEDVRECTVILSVRLMDKLLSEGPQRGLACVRYVFGELSPVWERLHRKHPYYRLKGGVPVSLTLSLFAAHGIRQALEAWDIPLTSALDADTIEWLRADLDA